MTTNRYTTQQWEAMDRARRAGVALTTGVYAKHDKDGKGARGKPKNEKGGKGPGGKPKKWFYLDKSGEHLQLGAFAAGVEEDAVARGNWRLHQQPARAEHAYLRNEFFLRVHEDLRAENACRKARGLGALGALDLGLLFGESCPEYPIFGAQNPKASAPPARARGNKGFEWFIPDGRMTISWPGVGRCAYDVEVEMRARVARLAEKVEKRVGWLGRLHEERVGPAVASAVAEAKRAAEAPESTKSWSDTRASEAARRARTALPFLGLPEEAVPVVFLFPRARQARDMRDGLREAAAEGRLPRYAALARELRPHADRRLGRLFLFAGWDEVSARGSVDGVYAALDPYPPGAGGDGTGLRQVAMYARGFVAADGGGGGR